MAIRQKVFPVIDDEAGKAMQELIRSVAEEGDSIGGTIECCISGVPAGIGEPIFDGLENRIASAIFGIPAVKGIEFGAGFSAAELKGSENNDAFLFDNGTVRTKTNHHGGILGGISSGMPILFRTAFKPTPSISREQDSVNLFTKENAPLKNPGATRPLCSIKSRPLRGGGSSNRNIRFNRGEVIVNLEECRQKIDQIDDQMADLFKERMDIAKEVADYKKAHGMNVLNREREREIIERNDKENR